MARSVRVLFATPYSTVAASGVSAFVRDMVDHLRADGEPPLIVEPSARAGTSGLANLLLGFRAALAVFRNRARMDVVHCQQLHLVTCAAGLMGRILGKGVVVTVHGRSPRPAGLRGLAFVVAEACSLRVPHRLFFVAEALRAEFGSRGAVIPNGVRVAKIREIVKGREAVRKELGMGNAKVILFVGRVTADKGVPTLLRAAEELHATMAESCRFVLVGPVADDLRAQAEAARSVDHVLVVGLRTDALRFYAAADIFVLPSFREGLPMGLLEALAAGLPVVATRVGDVPEVVEHGLTGLLIPPGDSHALSEAIRWMLRNPEKAAEMGARAAERVRIRFDFEAVWRAYQSAYGSALGRTRGGQPEATPGRRL